VSLAHDPKSGARVQVWRATEGQIQIELIEGTTFVEEANGPPWWVDGGGAILQAYDTPTVTCGDASLARNCIVAWASPALAGEPGFAAHYHYLRWVHFSVAKVGSDWTIYFGPVMSQSYVLHGSPVVSYRGPATAARPYVVMWVTDVGSGQSFRVYTALKSTGEAATWDNLVAHTTYNSRPMAALGSANNYAEIVHVRR
jgi:hypothetical protein